MPSFSRHSGFAAALMFLSACGVAVEKAPQTVSPRTVTDKTITETASAPEIPTSTETEISAAQAGNSADNTAPDIAQAEGQTIDDIIASLEAPDDEEHEKLPKIGNSARRSVYLKKSDFVTHGYSDGMRRMQEDGSGQVRTISS